METTSAASHSRRKFLHTSMKLGAMTSLIGGTTLSLANDLSPASSLDAKRRVHPLKILILGGTSFLGPHQIAYAMGRGHSITTFTRGKTIPTVHKALFKDVEALVGDRENNLEALKGRAWDVVIDNSGHRVHWTKATAELLKDHVGLYVYTSSTGVYYPYLGKDIKEDTKLVTQVPEKMNEEESLEYGYGVMKTNSESEARKAFGEDRTLVVRPTYMMGPGDRTDRFTYWPVRLAKGGEVMVPGQAHDPVQYIDVRDVATWMIRLAEHKTAGTFNAVGPASPTGMHQFIYGAHAAFSSAATFVPIDNYYFLLDHKVPYLVPWIMPSGNNAGSALVNNQLAIQHGLTFTPLAKSVWDIHEWWYSDAVAEERRKKMEASEKAVMAREKDIIKAWREYPKG